jgi:hypothetical protein
MSLAAFQRALADLAASPALCRRVRQDAGALDGYDLTEVERGRLVSAARQKGMAMNCMLYRSNRIAPIMAQLPLTCFMLGRELREVVDRFWSENPVPERNVPYEVQQFAAYLRGRIADGSVAVPLLGCVLEWEIDAHEVAFVPPRRTAAEIDAARAAARPGGPLRVHPQVRVTRFSANPILLVPLLRDRRPPPYDDVPRGEFFLLTDDRGEPRKLSLLEPPLAAAFLRLRDGGALAPEEAAPLLQRGIAVPA